MSKIRQRGRAIPLGIALMVACAAGARAQVPIPRSLAIETGAGKVVTLAGPAANVFVADPKVAEVHPASANTLFIFGVGVGTTSIAALDAAGHMLADTRVVVRPSTFAASEAEAAARAAVPATRITVAPQARGLLVSGQVPTPEDAARVIGIVRGYLGKDQELDNQLGVESSVQVMLRVRIAEVSRSVTRNLGINWQALGSIGRFGALAATSTGVPLALSAIAPSTVKVGTPDVNAIIDALAADNLARVLAEPNLTAMSGQAASFLAGGEFPIPVGQQNNEVTIQFKQYGVKLTFVPTVLANGRINLHVSPEVSELTTQGSVQLTAGNSSLQIPALTVRRAETTVEVGSGQSFAIAGLLQDAIQHNVSAVPFLGEIPVIGTLFRSDGFQRQETELVVVVTPYVARPVSDPAAIHLPGETYSAPSDYQRLIRLQQVATQVPVVAGRVAGQPGFIVQ